MSHNRAASLALVGLFVWVTGCSSYNQIELMEVADHGKVRVTTTDGGREIIRDPWVDADSIGGHLKGESDRFWTDPVVAFPIDQVSALEAVGTNGVGTLAVFVGIMALLVVGYGALVTD